MRPAAATPGRTFRRSRIGTHPSANKVRHLSGPERVLSSSRRRAYNGPRKSSGRAQGEDQWDPPRKICSCWAPSRRWSVSPPACSRESVRSPGTRRPWLGGVYSLSALPWVVVRSCLGVRRRRTVACISPHFTSVILGVITFLALGVSRSSDRPSFSTQARTLTPMVRGLCPECPMVRRVTSPASNTPSISQQFFPDKNAV